MRDAIFALTVLALLPLAAARPFVGVLLWSWISFMNPHQTLWGFALGLPWAELVFFATLLGCVTAGEPRRLAPNAVTALLLLFLLCVTATSAAALAPPERVWDKWEWVFKVILGLVLTASLLTDRWRVHALVWLMAISLGYYGVKGGLFTIATGGAHIVMGPPGTPIGDRNQLAVGLLVAIPLLNYLRLHSRHRVVRWGLVAAMVLTLFAVLGSQSRGALVGLAATALFLWARSPRKLVPGIAIVACVAAAIAFMPDSWRLRMDTIETYQEDGSAMSRLAIWEVSLRLALENPLLGGGFWSMYTQSVVDLVAPDKVARAAHSIWFEVLGEHGFPTFFVWLGVMVAGLLYAMRTARLARGREELRWARDLARMAQVSAVAYMSAGSFVSLSYWDFFWTLMVVLGATHAIVLRAVREQAAAEAAAAAQARPGWRTRAAAAAATAAAGPAALPAPVLAAFAGGQRGGGDRR